MANFSKLVSYDYLFTIDRVTIARSDKIFFILGVASLLLAVVFKIAARLAPSPVDRAVREKAYTLFLTFGALEVVWFGARFQAIRFFGSHFFAIIILLIGVVWFGYIAKDFIKNYRSARMQWEKEQVKRKYLEK